MSTRKAIGITVIVLVFGFLAAVLGFSDLARQVSPLTRLTFSRNNSGTETATASDSSAAPEFASGTWINSEPLTVKGLRGRVVLIARRS